MPKLTFEGDHIAQRDITNKPTTQLPCKNAMMGDNLYIEGDNLEVLKHLEVLLSNNVDKADLIITDPPYNTGGKDFVYNDRYGTDAWLTMMYPRMALCHDMLKEGGVLMVHIDKNEFHHLRCILDEIYGAKNHMIDFVWKKKVGGGNDNVSGYTLSTNTLSAMLKTEPKHLAFAFL